MTPRAGGGVLPLALVAAVACAKLGPDFDRTVALEVALPDSGNVEVGATLIPHARALSGRGDSVAAPIAWASLDTAVVGVLDTTTGATLGKQQGIGRLQARVGSLRSNPLTVRVQAPADSARAVGPRGSTVIVSTPDSLSDSLLVQVFATPPPAGADNLVGRRVVYATTIYPPVGPNVTLVPRDTVLTDRNGIAFARVRLVGGARPDSVVVAAAARRADGSPVPGTPLTFVVEFRP